MHSAKELLSNTQHLSVLYVEDDDKIREETLSLFKPFFKTITTAVDGLDGLEKYNNTLFDIIVTDINMPKMNGIEMVAKIKEINPEQKIIAISAHDESEILIDLIKNGVSSFILKPIIQRELINTLYPVCRDAYAQILNIELTEELNRKNEELQKQLKELEARKNTINTKHAQLETLLEASDKKSDSKQIDSVLNDYFKKDEDEGNENILFLKDDADELSEFFQEIPQRLSFAITSSSDEEIENIINLLSKSASILLHYSPYLDSLSATFSELATALKEYTEEFMEILLVDNEGILKLFDAVSSDMERYIERFSVESIAMNNAHHIHEPTMLSIRQIISLFAPQEIESGDIEFF